MATEFTGPQLPSAAALRERHKQIAVRAATDMALTMEAEWRRRASRSTRTGTYVRSITHRVTVEGDTVVAVVGTNSKIGEWVDDKGTGLYGPRNRPIVPLHAKALRFPAGGGHTFSPQTGSHTGFVNAPGFRATGQQRQGRAGAGATYIFARWVRGIKPRRYARTAALVTVPRVETIARVAGLRMAQALLGGGRL